MSKTRTHAIDGWFKDGAEPALIGTQCTACQSIFFPPERTFCRNPACMNDEFAEKELSRSGKLWSYTTNNYQPPAPFVSPKEEYEPFAVAAVELEAEKMIVLGQVPGHIPVEQLEAGMQMELVVDTLFEDDDNEYVVWKWRPA